MAERLMGNLFQTPQQVQAANEQRLFEQALAASRGGVEQQLGFIGARAGQMAGEGIANLFGMEDPDLKKARDVQRIAMDVKSTLTEEQLANPEAVYTALSKQLMRAGYTNDALQVADLAKQAQSANLQIATQQAGLKRAELSAAAEAELRRELAALGPNATEDQVLAVVTKYGSPDKIMAALATKQSREASREQTRLLAEQRLDIQRQGVELRKDIQATKLAEKDEKKQLAAEGAISNAGRVIQTVTEAKQLVGPLTTGMGGYLAVLPATDARKLQNKISTIKANLGFDRLQQMRDASPTGGALGQVAVQEINFLQSTVATLDQLESAADITAALNKIEQHYTNWKAALEGRVPAAYQAGGGQAAVPAAPQGLPSGVTVKRKGQ